MKLVLGLGFDLLPVKLYVIHVYTHTHLHWWMYVFLIVGEISVFIYHWTQMDLGYLIFTWITILDEWQLHKFRDYLQRFWSITWLILWLIFSECVAIFVLYTTHVFQNWCIYMDYLLPKWKNMDNLLMLMIFIFLCLFFQVSYFVYINSPEIE